MPVHITLLTGQLSPGLFRFGRLNLGLDVDVVVDHDLPFAATRCHHLQKTCAEPAFRVEAKTAPLLKPETHVRVSQTATSGVSNRNDTT